MKLNVGKSQFPAIWCMFKAKWGRVGGTTESITHFSRMSQTWGRDHRREKPRKHVRGGISKSAKSMCEHLETAFFFFFLLCLNLEEVNINPSAHQCKLGNNTKLVSWGQIKRHANTPCCDCQLRSKSSKVRSLNSSPKRVAFYLSWLMHIEILCSQLLILQKEKKKNWGPLMNFL